MLRANIIPDMSSELRLEIWIIRVIAYDIHFVIKVNPVERYSRTKIFAIKDSTFQFAEAGLS